MISNTPFKRLFLLNKKLILLNKWESSGIYRECRIYRDAGGYRNAGVYRDAEVYRGC